MTRREKLVSTVLEYLGTKPSKKQIGAVVILVVASYGLGVAQGQGTIGETQPTDCQDITNYSDKAYPDLEPYYNYSSNMCVVPEPLYNDSTPTNYSKLNMSGPVN